MFCFEDFASSVGFLLSGCSELWVSWCWSVFSVPVASGVVDMTRPCAARHTTVKWVAIDRKSFELEVVGLGDRWLRVTEFGKGRRFSIFMSREAALVVE